MGENENRIGKFTITLEEQLIFEDNPFLLDRLMEGLFVLRAEFMSWKMATEYVVKEIDLFGSRLDDLAPFVGGAQALCLELRELIVLYMKTRKTTQPKLADNVLVSQDLQFINKYGIIDI